MIPSSRTGITRRLGLVVTTLAIAPPRRRVRLAGRDAVPVAERSARRKRHDVAPAQVRRPRRHDRHGAVAARVLDATPLGRTTDVHPLVVLFALPAGATLFGLLGLVVSLPVSVFVIANSRSLVAALDRLAQWSWRGLVVAGPGFVAIQVVVRIPGVVVPALIAVVSAATLLPLVDRLAARGRSRGVAAAVSTVGATAAIAVAIEIALALTIGRCARSSMPPSRGQSSRTCRGSRT